MSPTEIRLKIILWLIASSYLLLLVTITIDALKVKEGFSGIWLLQILPLLLLLPGLLKQHYRSFSWLCFLMLAYFTGYVVQVYSPTRDPQDWISLALTLIIFIAGMFASRWLQRRKIPEKTGNN